jgi:hypothetical protein
LLFRPEGTMAAVVDSGSRIALKKLIVGRDFGSSIEVLDGATPQDAVVINPPDSLENGEQVAISGPNSDQGNQAPDPK